jgi:hypothetical protein
MQTNILAPSSPGQAMLADMVSRSGNCRTVVQEKNRREKLTRQSAGMDRGDVAVPASACAPLIS